ncbi:hypothetical protein Bra3105_04395 [Brachybacterium halotolerans subsp. kimchii]|uniref:hypothetical protein n=1 Tax=Brachybacterium TaxID=43668 RepID=UPI001E5208AE|nr:MULTISPECIES: hypothetical protein [Brachybacterium]MCG7308764.1 hypothetical protein [Brachybacterium sp. ACRRE]UEJ83560.1 hypothetical protein Bra3105_04395 [Brachybacterium halotolerans subsp. kimchii]
MTTSSSPSSAADPEVPGEAASCSSDPHGSDPHDHTGHDHPPTGAEIVSALVRGLSIVSLVIPAVAVVLVLVCLPATPSTPLPLVLGIALGALQLVVVVVTSMFVSKVQRRLAVNPGPMAVRSSVEEVLRLAAVLFAGLLWPSEAVGPMGIWLGLGTALVWIVLATAQTVSARRRIAAPSAWATEAVGTFLTEKVSVPRSMVLRVLDVVGTALFQIGATVLIVLSPVLTIGTIVLSIATGLSTLILQRRSPGERPHTLWAYAPFGIGVLTAALALLGLSTL